MQGVESSERVNDNRKNAIKKMAIENPTAIFEKLELHDLIDCESYLQSTCPIHCGDNSTAFTYFKQSGTWVCWTKHCHNENGSDILGLVMSLKEVSLPFAIKFVADALDINDEDLKKIAEKVSISSISNSRSKKKEKSRYDISCLSRLEDHNYLISRGFSKGIISAFMSGFARKGLMANRIVFPIFDEIGDLVGFSGRIVFEKCVKCERYHNGVKCFSKATRAKWKHSKGLQKASILYNLNNAKDSILKKKKVIICEGIFDCMKLYQVGVENVVAILGSKITSQQIRLLLSLGHIDTVYLIGDNDAAGKALMDDHVKKKDDFSLLSRYFHVETVEIKGLNDVAEMDDDEAIELCKRANLLGG